MRKILLSVVLSLGTFVTFSQSPSWMRYPAISPDGSTIVFTYMGDLYTVSSAGGKATQLTQHEAHDYKAVWAPDGQSIAFASSRNGNFDVYTIPAKGGSATRLTFHSAHDFPSSFSPNGKKVLFSSVRLDHVKSMVYPNSRMKELYEVSTTGGLPVQVLSIPALDAVYNKRGDKIYYHDKKGYENEWRKHHTSAEAKDVWVYDVPSGEHSKITSYEGEDRNPVPVGNTLYFLSERSGSFNVWQSKDNQLSQVTSNKKHPVRFLSASNDGVLCFSYDGEIYLVKHGKQQKVRIAITRDQKRNTVLPLKLTTGATDFDVSPDGKEIAFIARGDVFVTAVDYGTTKQISSTPEQERSVSFSPDGKNILYASERGGSWNIYEASRIRNEEKTFYQATLIEEKLLVESEEDVFQPAYSPDGKEIAYLEDRVIIKVKNLEDQATRVVLEKKYNYSYSDGDQWFQWSPDGKYILTQMLDGQRWTSELALVKADGSSPPENITMSGYYDWGGKWAMNGQLITWLSDRHGMKSHGGWGSQYDVYGLFLTEASYDRFKMTKEEFKTLDKEEKSLDDSTVTIDRRGWQDRKVKLTMHSSNLSDAVMSKEGDRLFYLSKFEKGYDLWVTNYYDKSTKLLLKLNGKYGAMQLSEDGKSLYLLSGGSLYKIDTKSGKKTTITFSAELTLDIKEERAYIFNHVTNLMEGKFYAKNMHGVDWEFYSKAYQKFLPHISNNWEFSEMLSELLGELNASHTGSGYRYRDPNGDITASLGIFPDMNFEGNGIQIAEVIEGSPLINEDSKVVPGTVITAIDGVEIEKGMNYYPLLNRKAGRRVLLEYLNPETDEKWEEVVRPISRGQESALLYQRWVRNNRKYVEEHSDGKVGYVHIKQMNDRAFRVTYEEIFGKCNDKQALVVDTRWNGGGWLHTDLIDLLNGKKYFDYEPRGQFIGSGPHTKWLKPSVVVMNEGNYSNGHMFPYLYKWMNIGKLVGMPVPGTGTAVWWEWQQDRTLYFGIPQVGIRDTEGKFLENNQLEPDIEVAPVPEDIASGTDVQLEKAIEEVLKK